MLAKTPPMGWNSWNTFAEDVTEALLMETADAMVSTGLQAAGYEYVVIDDCWSLRTRGADGRLVADPEKFPHGMKYLADYIHSKGLKFGMYSCAGTRTCAGYPSSFEYELLDAQTFAGFGVDFLKYDFCNKPTHADGPLLYHRMSMALKASGREILFSACNWGCDQVETWIRSTGAHMYRSTGDIFDNFQSMSDIARSQIMKLPYAGPGCFNDIDMLVCGMHDKGNVAAGGMNDAEYRFHFALWCVMQSPLMIGCDIRSMDEVTRATLCNKELIRINQDAEARPAYSISRKQPEGLFLGFKHLENNEFLLFGFNFKEKPDLTFVELFDVGLPKGCALQLHDVITGEEEAAAVDYVHFLLPAHGFKIYRGTLVTL
ncbi:MAG: glycoside hydrolase family 27 protein [Oscillospiraceae bacterium]|jgi:alpha-galactosidase|nr:glycoside hydrolase family 27 protein [Oscillospiraceae bacterium]